MIDAGAMGYAASGVAFLSLGVVLVSFWRGRELSRNLAAAVIASSVWSFILAWHLSGSAFVPYAVIVCAEAGRAAVWFAFLLKPFPSPERVVSARGFRAAVYGGCGAVALFALSQGLQKPLNLMEEMRAAH